MARLAHVIGTKLPHHVIHRGVRWMEIFGKASGKTASRAHRRLAEGKIEIVKSIADTKGHQGVTH